MVKTVFTTDIKEEDAVIEKWDWNAVKNALDDSARKFLTSQKNFEEDHSLMNGRLLISTITVSCSLYGILYDWYHPFPLSRSSLIFSVISYFISLGILTLYTTYAEKACFGAAKQTNDSGNPHKWKLSSKQQANSGDIYELEIEMIDGNTGKSRIATHKNSVSKWIDEKGKVCTAKFYNDMNKYCTSLVDDKKSK